MRLATHLADDGSRIGSVESDRLVDLADAIVAELGPEAGRSARSDMAALLQAGEADLADLLGRIARRGGPSVASPRLLAPVPRPGTIIGVGRNYGAHAAEGGLGRQEKPRLFAKLPGSVIGPGAPIARPRGVEKLDWEAELAVVIGRTMRDVEEDEALGFVAGYTVLNDVSAREYQFDMSPPQTSFAKSMDTFTPMGPHLVTADALDPSDLLLTCDVNGERMQEGRTSDMIFHVATLLSYVSRFVTLRPGDVIATGTPAGVGHFRDPPRYLVPGDSVTAAVEGIGELTNPVVDHDARPAGGA